MSDSRLASDSSTYEKHQKGLDTTDAGDPNISFLKQKLGVSLAELQVYLPDTATDPYPALWVLVVARERHWTHCLALVPSVKSNEFRRVGLCCIDATMLPDFINFEVKPNFELV
jgi:hypothetical protein